MRVLTWNVFHARDGMPGLGPTWASTLLGCPVDSGTHVHLNRHLLRAVGGLVARARPDVAFLQEVPPWAAAEIARLAGMEVAVGLTAPRIGPVALRGAIGRANPDIARTHEGNANAVLARAPWAITPGSRRATRLAPARVIARAACARRLGPREALGWWWERRGLVTVRVRHPDGRTLLAGSAHCHTDRRVVDVETGRAARAAAALAGDLPIVVGADLNADPAVDHAAFAAVRAAGLEPVAGPGLGIDHLLVRGVRPAAPARRWDPREREIRIPWRGGTRLVRISDHDPVEAELAL